MRRRLPRCRRPRTPVRVLAGWHRGFRDSHIAFAAPGRAAGRLCGCAGFLRGSSRRRCRGAPRAPRLARIPPRLLRRLRARPRTATTSKQSATPPNNACRHRPGMRGTSPALPPSTSAAWCVARPGLRLPAVPNPAVPNFLWPSAAAFWRCDARWFGRITVAAAGGRQLMQGTGALFAVAPQAAAVEPAIAGFWQRGREQSRHAHAVFWTRMAGEGLLDPAVDLTWLIDATSILAAAET